MGRQIATVSSSSVFTRLLTVRHAKRAELRSVSQKLANLIVREYAIVLYCIVLYCIVLMSSSVQISFFVVFLRLDVHFGYMLRVKPRDPLSSLRDP